MQVMTQQFLLSAIKNKDVDKALQLVQMPGYDVNIGVEKLTPLMLASKLGLISVAQRLIGLGADLTLEDGDGQSAMFHACSHGNSEVVQILLDAGCNVNEISANGDQPLHEAIVSGDLNTVKLLISAGANENRSNSISGYTPLLLAILQSDKDIVEVLLSAGATTSKAMIGGDTALHIAVQVAPIDIISSLVRAGSNLNVLNSMGESPLIVSVYEKRIDVARFLILLGSRMKHYDYFSPLCVACVQSNIPMILYLLSEGYNVSDDVSVKQNVFYKLEKDNPAVFEYIYSHRCVHPLSLKEIARFNCRKYLGPDLSSKVPTLPIPQTLRSFIDTDIIYKF